MSMDQLDSIWLPLAILVLLLFVLGSVLFFILRHLAEQRAAVRKLDVALSTTREYLDRRIEAAHSAVVESNELWLDKNHLINEAQTKALSVPGSGNQFFRRIGVRENLPPKRFQAFILMPFLNDYDRVLSSIKEACSNNGYAAVRSDEKFEPGSILGRIVELIIQSDFVICDVSSGNQNVYYELGIAHALNKSVIVISRSSESEKLPFDIDSQRIVFYRYPTDLITDLDLAIKALINSRYLTS